MYRILVFGDSHGNCDYMEKVIENIPCDLVVHLGDNLRDIENLTYIYPETKFEYVRGNCDFSSDEAATKVVEAEGLKILITHGHLFGVKASEYELRKYGAEIGADCILYGHTHQAKWDCEDGIPILNPGSGAYRGEESYGVIEIEDGEIRGCIIDTI